MMMNPTDIRPLGNRILVEQHVAEEVTDGGIVIPESLQERPPEGTVVACGPGVTEAISVGDTVIYRKWSSKAFTVVDCHGRELIVMDVDQVLAVRCG
jgi:chaperonin GroES